MRLAGDSKLFWETKGKRDDAEDREKSEKK
jgi:hypothetical protein